MGSYVQHLQEMSTLLTFIRKKSYINYNLEKYFREVSYDKLQVLEVGPGLGEFESYLNDKNVYSIDIVDNDQDILAYVTKRYRVNNSFLTKDLKNIDKKLGEYNFIFLMQVLEHLPASEYFSTVKLLYSHLKKNGYLVIVVPNGNNPLGLIERYADLQHTGCFTEPSLRDLIRVSGIEDSKIELKGYEIPPYDFINLIRIFLQKILHFILYLIMIINGGNYFKVMTPNIMLVVKKN